MIHPGFRFTLSGLRPSAKLPDILLFCQPGRWATQLAKVVPEIAPDTYHPAAAAATPPRRGGVAA
jgi:hypothetical protein